MYYPGSSCVSDDLSPEYRSWYLSQDTSQNLLNQSVDAPVQVEESWSPFLATSQPLGPSFIPTSTHANQDELGSCDASEAYRTVFNQANFSSENSWNNLYYMPLISTTSASDEGFDFCISSSNSGHCTNTDAQLPETSSNSSCSSSLYSTMLKKGLNSLPTFLKTCENSPPISCEQASNNGSVPGTRRNSYPNASSAPTHVLPPLASMPLDPISLKDEVPKKILKKPVGVIGEHLAFQELNESLLNNTMKFSGSQASKCSLNVNNQFTKTAVHEKEPATLPKVEERYEQSEKTDMKRRTKAKIPSSDPFQPESSPVSGNSQESVKKSKPKTGSNKNKGRTERGRHHRKRQSVPDTKEPSHWVNLVFQLQILIGQLPFQSFLASLSESLVALMGMAVGLLWVFAVLSYDWVKSLFYLVQSCMLRAYQWVHSHGGEFVSALFLKMPNIYGGSSASKAKKDACAAEEFNLPKTGEDAVQRLLRFKETDPYSILGIPSDATDEDIKRSYKSQAILVHPDKNHFTGAEEAFKVLASAFEILGNPESRAIYDKEHVLTPPRSEADLEVADFLEKFKQNIEEAQSILGCQNCGKTHKRYRMDRSSLEARYCASCKDMHAAREGDLWAETTMMGFKWHYYSYLDGAIYDVTEWVTCQPNVVSRVEANSHWVSCRLAQPKSKNRSTYFSRMENLKDIVNDMLNGNQNRSASSTGPASPAGGPPPPPQNGKVRTRRAAGSRRKK